MELSKLLVSISSFTICQMVDSWYSTDNYKNSRKISIGSLIKNPETIRFFPDHLKTKTVCKHAVKTLPFVTRYVPDWHTTQKICEKLL